MITQLVWQKVPNSAPLTWEQAITYAEGLTLANASDWRLPNIKELQSLNDETLVNPSVNSVYFPNIGSRNYWSSTTLLPNPSNLTSAWYWNTQYGITTYDIKTNTNYVLCVRGVPTVLSIPEINSTSTTLKVAPNPFTSKIKISGGDGSEKVELYNTEAKLIYSGSAIEKQYFSSLPNGIYILKIINKKEISIQLLKE